MINQLLNFVNKKILGAGLDVLENEQTITDVDYMIGINRLDKLTLEQAKGQIEEKNIEALNRTIMQLKIKKQNANRMGY